MKEKLDFRQYQGALSHLAFDSSKTLGRRFKEDEDLLLYGDIFDPFVLDELKITQGKFFRRLNDKTQVFPPELHANIRNRQVHTHDVVSIVTMIALISGLNVGLARAGAFLHDIGHSAYGHLGERIISAVSHKKFSHAVMSVVAAQKIERGGKGLNLSYETLRAALNHSRGSEEMALLNSAPAEESLVMLSDKIAYTFSDLNDAFKVGYLTNNTAPKLLVKSFGSNQREWVARTLYALMEESANKGKVSFNDSPLAQNFIVLRDWMYRNVYLRLDGQEYRSKREFQLREISEFFREYQSFKNFDPYLLLALLTDREASDLAWENRLEKSEIDFGVNQGFAEIAFRLPNHGAGIDIFNADLRPEDFKYHRIS
jgi:dGTPase